jgi:uncharacterized membrane protein YhhN
MALLAATVVAADGFEHAAGVWLVVAVVLGGVGDAFLVDPTEGRFIGGLASFLLGHLAYVGAFVAAGVDESWWTVGGAAVVIAAFTIARDVLPNAHRRGGIGLAAPVATYMCVIGGMTITGWSTGAWLVAAGTAIFVCSDTMLAINRFVRELTWSRLPVITTYDVGQFLIAAGVLRMIA